MGNPQPAVCNGGLLAWKCVAHLGSCLHAAGRGILCKVFAQIQVAERAQEQLQNTSQRVYRHGQLLQRLLRCVVSPLLQWQAVGAHGGCCFLDCWSWSPYLSHVKAAGSSTATGLLKL